LILSFHKSKNNLRPNNLPNFGAFGIFPKTGTRENSSEAPSVKQAAGLQMLCRVNGDKACASTGIEIYWRQTRKANAGAA
jgi:hypothetical protein